MDNKGADKVRSEGLQLRAAIGERLKVAMQAAHLSAKTLAERTGTSESGVKKWRTGTADAGFSLMATAAEVMGISLDWLATGNGNMWRPGLEAAGLVNSRTPIEPEKLGKVMAAVAQAFDELKPDADQERRAMAAAVIYEDVADFPGDEFRGGLGVLINRLRRELRGS